MGYLIADLELAEPLGELRLRGDQDGLALLLRAHGRPVSFTLHAAEPGTTLDAAELWRLAGHDASRAILAAHVRDELCPPVAPWTGRLTVAICTRARTDLLGDCLDSLLRAVDGDAAVEVLVVDNDPPDDATRALVASRAGVRYAREPRAGLDFARNRAIAEASGELVAFLDDDVVVDPGWLGGLRDAAGENPDAGAFTGLVLPYELETPAQIVFEKRGGFRRGMRKRRYAWPSQPWAPYFPVGAGSFGAGANMVVRRELVVALGGFDEALDTGPPLPGGGDLDIFQRIVRSGAPLVYDPNLLVFHRHRREHAALRRQYWSWGEGLMAFLDKTEAADPEQRAKIRGLRAWWLVYATRRVVKSLLRRDAATPDLPLAELAGGFVGYGGSYRRSRKRVAQLEERT